MSEPTVKLTARLDGSKIDEDLKNLQNQINKKELHIKTNLDTTASQTGMKKLSDSVNGVTKMITLLGVAMDSTLGGKNLGKPVSVYG